MVKVAITGAAGRMGQRLVALAHESKELQLVAAVERAESSAIGRDAGDVAGVGAIGVTVQTDLPADVDAVIDFTAPVATRNWLDICQQRGVALVIGTTGLSAEDHALIDAAANNIAVLQAPNMSLGVNLLLKVAADVAKALGDDYDKEIVELHHRFKKDAPSGTAMGLAESILKAMDKPKSALVYDRHGDDVVRQRGDIGMHALRVGDEIGRHTIYFAAPGERVELTHVATNRDTFVRGALQAARWIKSQKPGRYTMADVLGLVCSMQ